MVADLMQGFFSASKERTIRNHYSIATTLSTTSLVNVSRLVVPGEAYGLLTTKAITSRIRFIRQMA